MKAGRKMEVSIAQIEQFLSEHYGLQIDGVRLIGEGCWSKAYLFSKDSQELVIRLGRHEKDFLKDQRAGKFDASDLPIPKVLEVGKAFDGYFAISEKARGDTMLDQLDTESMRRTISSLMRMFNALRTADITGSSGYGMWDVRERGRYDSWHDALLATAEDIPGMRTHGWSNKLKESSIGDKKFQDIYDQFKNLVAEMPEDRYLIHNDVFNRNVFVQNNEISAVIDWANAMYGDFLYDLAHICFWQPWFPALRDIDLARETEKHYAAIGLDVPDFRKRILCYELHNGLDGVVWNSHIEDWEQVKRVLDRLVALVNDRDDEM